MGAIVFTWGRYGGFYRNRGFVSRICLGWLAIDYLPVEIEEIYEGYAEEEI